jgi:cobalamin synthase
MSDAPPSAGLCVLNLGPNGRRARRNSGLVGLVTGLLLAVALIVAGSPRPVRLLVVVPFWIGLAGLLQARGGT